MSLNVQNRIPIAIISLFLAMQKSHVTFLLQKYNTIQTKFGIESVGLFFIFRYTKENKFKKRRKTKRKSISRWQLQLNRERSGALLQVRVSS